MRSWPAADPEARQTFNGGSLDDPEGGTIQANF
jgi:hypothetical protein